MTVFEAKHQNIIKECLKNGGKGFEYKDSCSTKDYNWEEHFWCKKGFFRYYWGLNKTYFYDHMIEYEKELDELPCGITYEKNTTICKDEREEKNPKQDLWATCYYKTKYTIHVSESFSQHILNQYDNSRLVVWERPELQDALNFKDRVMRMHKKILEPLYYNGVRKGYILNKSGFSDLDCHGYSLREVEMKPLQDDIQVLGLMIAICENFLHRIPKDEIWFIEEGYCGFCIDKMKMIDNASSELLGDW